ncbi:MAG: diguanylate cyclase [Gemmatimonadota bacterium]|nr:diguanylate cyclase [Gemmatimonadota bacterium]
MTDLSPSTTPPSIALVLQALESALPPAVAAWIGHQPVTVVPVAALDELMVYALRSRPRFVVVDGRSAPDDALAASRKIKRDPYTGVVPVIFLARSGVAARVEAVDAMADEVIATDMEVTEAETRLRCVMVRSDRDVNVHPSTRLPGAPAIDDAIRDRLETPFAACYADLDHFKEFNDRYSYVEGDRVIRLLATLLHDTVRGLVGDEGFVGHIGGDDFIFLIPRDRVDDVCAEIVQTFDTLIAYQYSEHDRRAGYFFGKDRRGQLHRVPLMTLSIGVVTNERRTFTESAAVSALVTEMKTYAKTLPGSVYAVDRRTDERAEMSTSPLTETGARQ